MSVWSLSCQETSCFSAISEKHLWEFYPQHGGKSQLALKLRHCHNMYKLGLLSEGDSLASHRGQMYSTRDQDNDVWPRSCSESFKGAWWYDRCHRSNLNGAYLRGNHTSYADGVGWRTWTGFRYSLRFTEMKIRPFNSWILRQLDSVTFRRATMLHFKLLFLNLALAVVLTVCTCMNQ